MNTLHQFKELISKIEYSEIKNVSGDVVGWNSYIYESESIVKAGGTGETREVALRIAYAELIERATFHKISKLPNLNLKFQFPNFPTTCGFAAGFSKADTKNRAICEAIERWCFSEWIDEGKFIEEYQPSKLNSITQYFVSKFDHVEFYIKKIDVQFIDELNVDTLYFCACLGYKKDGVFLGSRVSNDIEDLFQHAAVEAFRANIIHDNLDTSMRKGNFYTDRIKYWGSNKNNLPDLKNFEQTAFSKPKLALLEEYTESEDYFVFRALCEKFQPWHIGDEKRFVY